MTSQYYKLQKKFTFGDLNEIIQPGTVADVSSKDLIKVKLESDESHLPTTQKSKGKGSELTTEQTLVDYQTNNEKV